MTRFQRWLLYVSTAVAASSGVAYFCMKRFLTPPDPWAVVNHPLEPWTLKLHILSAPVMLFAVGLITTQHIWRSLKSSLPTGRKSGLVAAVAFVPLVATGYLIQVVTHPTALEILAWTHLALGLAVTWALASHRGVLRPRRLRRRAGALPVLPSEDEDAPPERVEPAATHVDGGTATDMDGDHPTRPSDDDGARRDPEPVGAVTLRPEAAVSDASPSASGTRGRRSGSCRPRTDLREESSSAASS